MTHFPNCFRLPPAKSFSTLKSYLPEVGRVGLRTQTLRLPGSLHRGKTWTQSQIITGFMEITECLGGNLPRHEEGRGTQFLTMAQATLTLASPGTIECWNPLLYIAPTKVCLIFVFFFSLARQKSTNITSFKKAEKPRWHVNLCIAVLVVQERTRNSLRVHR